MTVTQPGDRRRFQYRLRSLFFAVALASVCFSVWKWGFIKRTREVLTPLPSGMVRLNAEIVSYRNLDKDGDELEGRLCFFGKSPFRVHLERYETGPAAPVLTVVSHRQLYGHPETVTLEYTLKDGILSFRDIAAPPGEGRATFASSGPLDVLKAARGETEFMESAVYIIRCKKAPPTPAGGCDGNVLTEPEAALHVGAWCEWIADERDEGVK